MKASYLQQAWWLTRDAVQAWLDDYASSMGAALAYYTILSLAPMMVIMIAIAGFFFGHHAAHGEIVLQLRSLVGDTGAAAIEGLLKSAGEPHQGLTAGTLGSLIFMFSATAVFNELQSSLDRIWKVPAATSRSGSIWSMVRNRLLAIAMVTGLGFVLLAALLLSIALEALGTLWSNLIGEWSGALHLLNFGISFAVITGLFALIFKFMPRARIPWRDVWVGALVTAVLFMLGKSLLGIYLSRTNMASSFGAAGSLVVLLIWIYYSAQIFLLGAEFTRAFAQRHGSQAGAAAASEKPPVTKD